MVQLLWKTIWQFLKQLHVDLAYDPAIPLLDKYDENTYVHIKTYT